jgi:capsular exopolysaccharide synthesis family protein
MRQGSKIFLIMSHRTNDGRSFTAANLALSFADVGHRALLIDSDFRNPTLHEIFQIPERPGLTEIVSDSKTLELAVKTFIQHENLYVLTRGTPPRDPVSLIGSESMEHLLTETRKEFDIVIIDTSSFTSAIDSLELSRIVDEIVFVVREGKTRRSQLLEAKAIIEKAGVHPLGAVLNARVEYDVLRSLHDTILFQRRGRSRGSGFGNNLTFLRRIAHNIRKLFG